MWAWPSARYFQPQEPKVSSRVPSRDLLKETMRSYYYIPCHSFRCQGHIPLKFEVQLMDYIAAHPWKGIFILCKYALFKSFLFLRPAGWKRGSNTSLVLSGRSRRSRRAWRTSATGTQSSGSPSTYSVRNLRINTLQIKQLRILNQT